MTGFYLGPSTVLSDRHIRTLLKLARPNKKDVFYDLGCGSGRLCIIAVKEFDVKRAVGIDNHRGRVKQARRNVQKENLQDRIKIRYQNIEKSDLKDATVVYCGLMEEEDTLQKYEEMLSKNCKLITLASPPVSIIPFDVDYPFYMMKFPFKKTKNSDIWATSVLLKNGTLEELLDEMKRDPDWSHDVRLVKKLARIRFS